MSDTWSGLTTEVVRTKRTKLRAMSKVVGVVIHTTGGGIVTSALKKGIDPLRYAANYYARPKSAGSHYLVGPFADVAYDENDDCIIGTVPENFVAWHSGLGRSSGRVKCYKMGLPAWPRHRIAKGSDGKKYMKDYGKELPDYMDWLERWPNIKSPLDLIPKPWPGTGMINGQFIGVDMLAPEPGESHGEQQLRWTAALVRDICERHGVPLSKRVVLRHSDVDPFSRSTKRGGWDPPTYAFQRVCELLGVEP